MFSDLDMQLQKDLISFVESENERTGKTLGDIIISDILTRFINDKVRITGCVTDHGKKKMYIEFSFGEGVENG